jgi:diguanylate cyclase (GGDEF)-like protein/hemerythrin-like metal-binding protein/PAS domain S-box-containing protein
MPESIMTASTPDPGAATDKYRLPLYLALVAAGLAGNYFKFPIFLNTDFLFGSIFAMLILQLFGPARSIPAAFVIASYTYFLWNQPYSILIMTLEVAVVGALMGRRKMGMIQADTLFWLLVGMPLVYLFFHLGMQVPLAGTCMIMMKQALNGIGNALLARLLFTGHVIRSRSALIPLRETICNTMAFFVLCPALFLLALGSRHDFNETDHRVRATLGRNSSYLHLHLDDWVQDRKTPIANLAQLSQSRTPQQMQAFLEQAQRSDTNFRKIALLDRDATIRAIHPRIDELGHISIGKNLSDRPFIPQLKRTLQPMLSEIMLARTGKPQPMVAMIAPVVLRGEYGGYVTGILSLQQLQDDLEVISRQEGSLYTLLDKNGKVIMSNRADQKVMQPFARGKGTLNRLDATVSQWVPLAPHNTPLFERWQKSYYVAQSSIGGLAEWDLILEQPVAPFQKALNDSYLRKLTLLFLSLILSLGLAEFISRRITATIEQLHRITRDLPSRLATGATIDWPESSLRESSDLINNFRQMSASIRHNVLQLRSLNDSLEQRVEERTYQLQLSISASNIGLWDWNPLTGAVKLSPEWKGQLGYADHEFPDTLERWRGQVHPEDLPEAEASLGRHLDDGTGKYAMEYRVRHKDGSYRWMGAQAQIFRDAAGKALLVMGCHIDITERKHQEALLREQEQFVRATIDGLSANICVVDASGKIVITNKPWNLFAAENGATEQNCGEGANYFRTCSVGTREEQAETAEILAGIRAVLAEELPEFVKEYPYHSPDVQRWFLCRVNPFQAAGKNYVVISHEDISERRRSEEAMQECYRQVEALSITDGMTGIANRRHFDEVLVQEHARHARSGAELSLILLDVDHFKLFNDRYGHLAGDECLRQIARVMAQCSARPADLAARFGGEEFVCILPDTDQSGAVFVAERMRRGILELAIPHQDSAFAGCVTASLGVVSLPCTTEGSPLDLVCRVDELLYRAKSRGRNRIEFDALSQAGEVNGKLVHLVWKEAFCCGNPLIDSQHQGLFQASNELLAATLATRPAGEITALVAGLLSHVELHFRDEEALLESSGFPGREAHAAEHAKLLARGAQLAEDFATVPGSNGELLWFLVHDIVLVHLLGADREFALFVGAQPAAGPEKG